MFPAAFPPSYNACIGGTARDANTPIMKTIGDYLYSTLSGGASNKNEEVPIELRYQIMTDKRSALTIVGCNGRHLCSSTSVSQRDTANSCLSITIRS